MKKALECYFGCKVAEQYKKCAPHVPLSLVRDCLNNKRRSMPFAIPMI